MSRLIMLLAIGVVAWLIYKLYFQKLRQQGKPGMLKIGLIALGIVFMALAVTGRAHIAFALLGAALTQVMRFAPLLVRYFPAIQQLYRSNRPFGAQGQQQSSIRTKMITATLQHETGEIDGQITAGKFSGRALSSLSREELEAIYLICQEQDFEGARLLQTYISRLYGDYTNTNHSDQPNAIPDISEALEILGVDAEAGREEIIAAHKRLMGKMHPDKGGSNYLAAKINAAKEVLLDDLKQRQA